MKKLVLGAVAMFMLMSFSSNITGTKEVSIVEAKIVASSFSLINDTKSKVSIHTGSGFVSLNKGSRTSIGCNVGKKVRWANSGSKGDVIFEITSSMCGKTLKLSDLMD